MLGISKHSPALKEQHLIKNKINPRLIFIKWDELYAPFLWLGKPSDGPMTDITLLSTSSENGYSTYYILYVPFDPDPAEGSSLT